RRRRSLHRSRTRRARATRPASAGERDHLARPHAADAHPRNRGNFPDRTGVLALWLVRGVPPARRATPTFACRPHGGACHRRRAAFPAPTWVSCVDHGESYASLLRRLPHVHVEMDNAVETCWH